MKPLFPQTNELLHMYMFLQDFVYILELTHNSKEQLLAAPLHGVSQLQPIYCPANIYLLRINKRNTRTRREIYNIFKS